MTLTWVALASAAATPSLRPDAPALSLDVARASPPNVLADRILSPGHHPIVEAFVHPANMEAPVAWVTRIDLVEQPTLDPHAGLCRADVIDIEFEPTQAQHPSGFRPSPARPTNLTVQNYARLAAAAAAAPPASCQVSISRYFRIDTTNETDQLALVQVLAGLKQDAAAGRHLPASATFDDQMADTLTGTKRIPDFRQALIAFPLDELGGVQVRSSGPNLAGELDASDATWAVRIGIRDGRVIKLDLVRRIPPPF